MLLQRIRIILKDIYHSSIDLDFVRQSKKTKQLAFHLTFRTTDLQDIIYTTLGDYIKVSFDKVFFFIPKIIAHAETQFMFNDSINKSFTLSFGSWSTDRKKY